MKKAENRFSGTDISHIFLKNANREHIHLLNVCRPGRSACRLLIFARFSRHCLCPSDLGECSLVFCCSLQNLHWVFGHGLQCFWDQKIFLETFLFRKVTISSTASVFADFQTLKIWVPPNSPCFKGFFEKIYILSSSARSFLPNFLHPEVFKTALWISSENFFSRHSWWHGENNTRLLPCKILSPAHFFSHSFQLWITVCPLLKVINPLSRSPHRRLHLPAWNW